MRVQPSRILKRGLGEPVSALPTDPETALTDTGWWLNRVRAAGDRIRPGLVAAFPSLARGIDAANQRASAVFTEFDGLVPEAGRLLDPAGTDRSISVTTLEDAAACPFRLFLSRGLGVEPLGESPRHARRLAGSIHAWDSNCTPSSRRLCAK